MRRIVAVLAGAAAALALGALPAAARQEGGGVGIRLVDAGPARADPRARIYLVDRVRPGAVLTRRVEVSNREDAPVGVDLYVGGAEVGPDGFTFLPGRTPNELVGWARVVPASLVLAPHTTAEATVTVAVPADAAAGERYGVVWAELAPGGAPGGVAVVNRVGVRIYLSVEPAVTPAGPGDRRSGPADASGLALLLAVLAVSGGAALVLAAADRWNRSGAGARAGTGAPVSPS